MTSKADSIYCSGLLPVLSIEAIEAARGKPLHDRADPGDDPETMLLKKRDRARLMAWVGNLPQPLREVAMALIDGDTQATIAARLMLSQPAITKRVRRLVAAGRAELGDLRGSPILT